MGKSLVSCFLTQGVYQCSSECTIYQTAAYLREAARIKTPSLWKYWGTLTLISADSLNWLSNISLSNFLTLIYSMHDEWLDFVCAQLIHFIYNNYAEIWRQEMSNCLPIVQYISHQTAHPTLTGPFLILRLTFRQQQKVIKNLSASFQNETYKSVTSWQISTHIMPQSAWKWDSWLEKCQSSHSRHGLQHLPVTLSQS